MYTTINKIREYNPNANILKSLSKTYADDAPIKISAIFASNGFEDALYCLRAVDGYDKEIRLYAVWCARQVQHLMLDERSLATLDVAERYAYGQASAKELKVARAAARAAAVAVWAPAGAAAWEAAGAAAWDAAWDAARAAWAAGAAMEAAGAARAAARNAQAARLCEVCELIEAKHAGNR
jgi:hypothetical protein